MITRNLPNVLGSLLEPCRSSAVATMRMMMLLTLKGNKYVHLEDEALCRQTSVWSSMRCVQVQTYMQWVRLCAYTQGWTQGNGSRNTGGNGHPSTSCG